MPRVAARRRLCRSFTRCRREGLSSALDTARTLADPTTPSQWRRPGPAVDPVAGWYDIDGSRRAAPSRGVTSEEPAPAWRSGFFRVEAAFIRIQ
jgi:hypothetical protein